MGDGVTVTWLQLEHEVTSEETPTASRLFSELPEDKNYFYFYSHFNISGVKY